MPVMFEQMVVAGVGLIGGSLALAAKKRGLVRRVVGFGRNEAPLQLARKKKIIDAYFLRAEAFPPKTDLLVVGTPVGAIVPVTRSFLPHLEEGCLVTDVGSVKRRVVSGMERLLGQRHVFVGGHPIAGGEQWGPEAARAELFVGRRCILTPTPKSQSGAVKKLALFWRNMGAEVELMDAGLHDRILGVVSHLPHVVAYALVNAVDRTKIESKDLAEYCGGGFKDTTRIAASRPELWRDICFMNREAVLKGLREYMRVLQRMTDSIQARDPAKLEAEFSRALRARQRIS
jgi:prephenate dehydrogenase